MGTSTASCSMVCFWTRACGPRGSPRQGGREPRVAVALRTCPCAPPPQPCPSSVLLRSGAYTRTGPSRRSAARASATSAGVCPFDGCRCRISVDNESQYAPDYGGRVPVDTTPGPVPLHRAPKNLPLISANTARDAWPPAKPALNMSLPSA